MSAPQPAIAAGAAAPAAATPQPVATPAQAAPAPRVLLVPLGGPAAVCDGDTCALPPSN